ncbi:WD40 repeat-like protein [Laetiporus sulphureus 93-53]|uniref:WD40 repeat-like protein n=1 Tax=Laetiporus sulphureus 93-53 TaxID=1314785 RepID=A0A165BE23_9APHY|nr:WD40 repeat-like protein [Laetiporus sulphureus 93-53]KZT00847.1 WD40 repeat-like protein [Laetiporus sulphureus 93-53]
MRHVTHPSHPIPAMSAKAFVNSAHQPGCTCIAFARDGSRVYTGGIDSLVRIWRTDLGANQEPDAAIDAAEGITALTTGRGYWFSGSSDSEVRRYAYGKTEFEALVTNAIGVPIRCVAVDPQSARIAVTSDEPTVKVIDIEDTTNISVLGGHTKAVRKATWHPSGSLLTTCGADGKIIIWDVSEGQCKEEKAIEGIIPAVANADSSEEFAHDCSAIWHTSGQYFFVATRAHEIITISRSDWTKSSTFVDDALSGAITALALSNNGVYLACACKAGVFIWSTETRRLLYRYDGKQTAIITQMAFSPSQNLLAWTDMDGVLTRWAEPIPATAPDPVKLAPGTASMTVPIKRKAIPMLFDDEADAEKAKDDELDVNETVEVDYENDDWILDDLGGAMDDDSEEKKWSGKDGVKEMVSVTKAQPPFQPGSTPMENKKGYLVYNMIGVIEVTDQDTHHIVNVEFHDKSARKGYHFTDHFKYDLASLGERGAVYACRPEQEHPARVTFKPYGTWATQGEWTYELPKGTRVLGVAAGGAPSSGSRRDFDSDLQGNGNVVIATSANELIFMTGTGIERQCLSLQGDFVTMVAGPEWVFVVHRDGATTMDGSQNLTGRLIKFDDFCLLQKDTLPIPKKCTLKWIGITEEGAPAIYDSAGILNIMPRYRAPFSATWTRVLDTNLLERREGKQESYWPIGVAADNLMCLILKGRQEHPGFPRPLIQELPLRLPFHHLDPKEAPLEEHFARESMMLDILRDGLGDELTTDDIFRRELALDKELVQLIQLACKNDRLTRAVDLTRLLHHTSSFDMAIKVAAFYHLVGLQEKMGALKEEREATDLLANSRDGRRQRAKEFLPVPATVKMPTKPSRPRAFQDFKPPSPKHRPGLERATPVIEPASASFTENYSAFGSSLIENDGGVDDSWSSPSSKRKRSSEEDEPAREFQPLGADSSSKRRNLDEIAATVKTAAARPSES